MLSFDPVVSLNGIFCTGYRFLNLLVNLCHLSRKFIYEVLFILLLMLLTTRIVQEFLLQEVIVPFLTRACVVFGVWKEVTRTKAYKVELADILITKVVSHL